MTRARRTRTTQHHRRNHPLIQRGEDFAAFKTRLAEDGYRWNQYGGALYVWLRDPSNEDGRVYLFNEEQTSTLPIEVWQSWEFVHDSGFPYEGQITDDQYPRVRDDNPFDVLGYTNQRTQNRRLNEIANAIAEEQQLRIDRNTVEAFSASYGTFTYDTPTTEPSVPLTATEIARLEETAPRPTTAFQRFQALRRSQREARAQQPQPPDDKNLRMVRDMENRVAAEREKLRQRLNKKIAKKRGISVEELEEGQTLPEDDDNDDSEREF